MALNHRVMRSQNSTMRHLQQNRQHFYFQSMQVLEPHISMLTYEAFVVLKDYQTMSLKLFHGGRVLGLGRL